ncbi:Metalloprotease [Annulohypoxylon maeteangense]|uniref:Metalloprotease n=1 Tax=Annulohypoxylon maeteangense TaxID=1927788 RepID=UPI00200762A3|nr:Metalloprotease [Annulohypoxylon maeteangense]KAI0889720.1 Metalloprotease [Annulohypoxylon maeteangense]
MYATNSSLCLTDACIKASSTLYSNLSPNYQNIDPCTNFEEMVCGGFRERYALSETTSSVSEQTLFTLANYVFMKNILEAPYDTSLGTNPSVDEMNFEKLVKGYNTCLNETAITELGVQPLVTFLGNITEIFPVTTAEYKSNKAFGPSDYESFSDAITHLFQYGMEPFFGMTATIDPFNPDTYIPVIAPTGPVIGSAVFADEESLAAYEKVVAETFANVLPTNESRSIAKELAHDVVELETKVVSISSEAVVSELFDLTNITALDNATQLAPAFNFASVLKTIIPAAVNRTSYPFPEYSASISEILANSTKRAIQGYFLWQAIVNLEDTVYAPELQALKQLIDVTKGNDPSHRPERWKFCMNDVNEKMSWLLSKPFVEAKYTDAVEKTLREMTTRIQNRLARNIDNIEWMTDKVKAIAKHKVEAITQKLGYPQALPNLDDADSLRNYYCDLQVTDSYFANSLSHQKWYARKTALLVGTKRQDKAWPQPSTVSALTINAFYLATENSITIIAGTLQQLLFDPGLPAYLNYGALGTVIGHEYTHSLDNNGRRWDDRGALANWWDAESDAGFENRTQCLIQQVSGDNITLSSGTQLPVNGTLTLGENIADTGGINTAYDAWLDKRQEDPAADFDIPGLAERFTREQLFYVAAGQFFCDKASDAAMAGQLTADVHAPNAVRIKTMMENSRGFREAFKCPVREPTCVIY